jgi:hypothetical protein
MDEADQAQPTIDAEIESLVFAARQRMISRRALRCLECGDPLPAHRQPYGLCVDCKANVELREKTVRPRG